MMSTIMNCPDELIDEVVQLFNSDQLLSGSKNTDKPTVIDGDGMQVSIVSKDFKDFCWALNPGNEESTLVTMKEDYLNDIDAFFVFLSTHGASHIDDRQEAACNKYEFSDETTLVIEELADQIDNHFNVECDFDSTFEYVESALKFLIEAHLSSILGARIITSATEFLPLEAVFTAYQMGLLPYGWNVEDDSLECFNPIGIGE